MGAGVDGDAFAQDGFIADDYAGRTALEFEILRGTADPGKGVYDAIGTNRGVAIDNRVSHQLGPRADFDIGADHAVCTEFNAFAKLGTLFNNGCGVYFFYRHLILLPTFNFTQRSCSFIS